MAGIGNVQLGVSLTGQDVHNIRLTRTATGMSSQSGGFIWNPTTRHILKREETDKQNDDNLTFLFEYRALLNSRVQTLITQLSNALASDLDVAMNASNVRWGDRPAMNGKSGNTIQDPGAARTAYNFLMGWFSRNAPTEDDPLDNTADPTPPSTSYISPAAVYEDRFTANLGDPDPALAVNARGTASIVTAQAGIVADKLYIRDLYSGNPTFLYNNTTSGVNNRLDDSFSGPLGAAALGAKAKNLFQKVLFETLSSIEYKAVLSSGLFKNLIISASSSLPTGSQIQASFSLNFQGTQDGGTLFCNMDKMTAFYHS